MNLQLLPVLDPWEFGELSISQKEEYLRLKEIERENIEFEALLLRVERERAALKEKSTDA